MSQNEKARLTIYEKLSPIVTILNFTISQGSNRYIGLRVIVIESRSTNYFTIYLAVNCLMCKQVPPCDNFHPFVLTDFTFEKKIGTL